MSVIQLWLSLVLLLLGSAVAQNSTTSSNSSAVAQNQTTTGTNSSTLLIVAALFNNSLCQQSTVDLRTYVDGQCNQIGSQSVWLTCNQTDPSNPSVLWQSFSSQAACMSALSSGAAALAMSASVTSYDTCSPIGNDTALNVVACTDSAHVANITTVPSFATVSTTDPSLTYTFYAWNGPNCQGPPTVQKVKRFLTECSFYPEYWGPAAGFCVPGGILYPSYSDSECTQVNASLPFTLEPTGICFSLGDFSYIYGPCQATFNYTGLASLPKAQNLTAILAQLTPPSSNSASFNVAAPNSSQVFNAQEYQDTQCTTKVSTNGLQSIHLGNCSENPNAASYAGDNSKEFFCTDAGVVAVTWNSLNCSGHHRTAEIYRFDECSVSDILAVPIAVSNCTPSQIPASIE